MPRVRRQNLPRDLWKHLLDRLKRRNISVDQLGLFADWLATEPEVPYEKWFKKFPGFTVCGEGELKLELVETRSSAVRPERLPADFFARIAEEFGNEPFERRFSVAPSKWNLSQPRGEIR